MKNQAPLFENADVVCYVFEIRRKCMYFGFQVHFTMSQINNRYGKVIFSIRKLIEREKQP